MFKIQDGRKSFTQWDLNRKIIVEDDSIVKVHFTNLLNKTALVSEVKNHLADVPNVLLQDYGTILIYGYDGNYTKYVEAFRVVRKEKPEDYIYTETEVLNYNNLLERMNNIEGSIEQVVTDYLRENPPKVDLDGYATKEYVDNAIAAISAVDLSDYFTKEEANAKFATKEEIPSTSGLATEEFVNGKVSGLASERYVDNAVAAIPQPDLSGYALKSEIPSTVGLATEQYVNEAVSNVKVDLTGYATEEYVDNAVAGIEIPEVDLSGYALKSEIPSTAGLATEEYVNEAVAGIEIPEEIPHLTGITPDNLADLENGFYYSNDYLHFTLENSNLSCTVMGYFIIVDGCFHFLADDLYGEYQDEGQWYLYNGATTENLNNIPTNDDMNAAISEAVAAIEIPEVDLSGYQEKLTAGDNITIEGNVISATSGGSGGSVSVDGTTIIQNSDGTISSAIGKKFKYANRANRIGLSLITDGNTDNSSGGCGSVVFGFDNALFSYANNNYDYPNWFFVNGKSNGVMAGQYGICIGLENSMVSSGGLVIGCKNSTMDLNNNLTNGAHVAIGDYLKTDNSELSYATILGKYGALQKNQLFGLAYGSSTTSAPIFSVDTSGNVNANGTISGSGSDYAEYFEWQDGNPEGEDRVGLIVALRGDKIVLAQDGDDVLGIVSGTATVLGDNAEYTWSKIHLRDDFGRLIYEDVVFENEDGTTYTEKHPKMNPAYNPEEEYIARSKRKEWDVVGMLGKLYVRDDGTCGAGGYAKVGADGIATLSQEPTNMYVMKRTAANIVRVLFK